MSGNTEPRRWTIGDTYGMPEVYRQGGPPSPIGEVEVVEASAYDALAAENAALRRDLDALRLIVRHAGLAFGLPIDAPVEMVSATITREWFETKRAREHLDVRHDQWAVQGREPSKKHAEYVAAASTGLEPAGRYLSGTQLSRSGPWGFSKRDGLDFVSASQIVELHGRTPEELADRLVLIDRAMWHSWPRESGHDHA